MKRIKNLFKYLAYVILAYICFCFITPFSKSLRNRTIRNQISYLSEILNNGYDNELQNRFPEGKLFSNSLLALSVIEYCEGNMHSNKKYAKIVDDCIARIQSEKALENFPYGIQPKYGMFYNAWTNLVYSSYLKSKLIRYSNISSKVKAESKAIKYRIKKALNDSTVILNSYVNEGWPADNLIGAIALDDQDLKQQWINAIKLLSKHPTGLIHHYQKDKNTVRGSSGAMISYGMNKANYPNAVEYNNKFSKIFIDEYLGVQLVKENENGSNVEDVDSGPIVLGYGASATIMNIKTQASYGSSKAKLTWGAINFLGLPVNMLNQKYYLFKKEPMFDLFMLWACSEF